MGEKHPNKKNIQKMTGSSQEGGPVFIEIGKIHRPHGFNGEMSIEIYSEYQDDVKAGTRVFVGVDYIPTSIFTIRPHNKQKLITFQDFKEDIRSLDFRNAYLYRPSSDLPKPTGERNYYSFQLKGMQVVNENGEKIGVASEVLQTGANDVLVVLLNETRAELLVPIIEDVIIDIDHKKRMIIVHLQEWD